MEQAMLVSIALPGVLAFGVMLAGVFLPRTFNACGRRPWAEGLLQCALGAVAVGGGFLLAFHMVEGLPELPPRTRWHWLALMGTASAAVGCVNGLWLRSVAGRIVTGVLLAAVASLMLHPLPAFENHWLWKTSLGAAVFVIWFSGDTYTARRPGHLVPLAMMLTFSAASVVVVIAASSAKFATLVASLACIAGALMVLSIFAPTRAITAGAMAVMATLLPAWMLMGRFYDSEATQPLAGFALVAFAPLALWLGEVPVVNRWGGWKAWLVRVGLVAVVLGIAAAIVLFNAPPPMEPYDYDYGY
jgi:hypothetical protein